MKLQQLMLEFKISVYFNVGFHHIIDKLSIMQGEKRKSRNSKRCSSVANPFYGSGQNSDNIKYLPLEIVPAVSVLPYLSCQQIYSFPALMPGQTGEQGLALMKKAREWQNSPFPTINQSGQQQKQSVAKVHDDMGVNNVAGQVFYTGARARESIYEVLFFNDGQDLLMSPCPLNLMDHQNKPDNPNYRTDDHNDNECRRSDGFTFT